MCQNNLNCLQQLLSRDLVVKIKYVSLKVLQRSAYPESFLCALREMSCTKCGKAGSGRFCTYCGGLIDEEVVLGCVTTLQN